MIFIDLIAMTISVAAAVFTASKHEQTVQLLEEVTKIFEEID